MRIPSVIAAFAAHEWRTQTRSLRFRVIATLYVLAGSAPAVLAYVRRLDLRMTIGGATYAGETAAVVPALTAVFVFLLSIDALQREREERSWSTVSLAGMSSSGYLLRRWLALQAVILPLTAVPFLAAAVAAGMGSGPGAVTPGPLVVPWLLHAVPIALATSALALGAGTIAGSTAQAFLLTGVILVLVPMLVNGLLGFFGFRFADPLAWIGVRVLFSSVRRMASLLPGEDNAWSFAFPLEVSESPYDAGVAGAQYLAWDTVPVALAAAVLGMAVLFLRRTRPDVRPLRISPTHPLRTFLATLARLRERYTPDPVPARVDLLAPSLALLVTVGASALILGRSHSFEALGNARFEAEGSGGPAPMADDVLPGRWRVEGTLGPGQEVALAVRAEMRNTGREPRSHLAFELNPFLRVTEAGTSEGRLTLAQRWDRIAADLSAPIPPGGTRELHFRLAGEPGAVSFVLPAERGGSFYKRFYGLRHARFRRDLTDLSASYRVPALSARRIDLAATSLTPVPRYQPWTLDEAKEVPVEPFNPLADVSLSLATPQGLFLADSCGGTSHDGRLANRCRLPLADLMVAGGSYQELAGTPGGATVAVYPFHKAPGELHLGFLARGTRKLEEAWPGLGDLRRTVVLEWPESYVHELDTSQDVWSRRWDYDPFGLRQVRTRGELVLLNEMDLIRVKPLDPNVLVAGLVSGRLSRRRPLAPDDAQLFLQLFRNLALQRLGLGGESGALVVGLRPGEEESVKTPPPVEGYWGYWSYRFPALVAALRIRMGEEPLRRAIDELLARKSAHPVTRDELYALLKERSEVPLDRMIQDFFVEGLLPEPELDGVTLRRSSGGWTVTGRMVNRGSGEALCRIVLTTDLGPVETVARAGTGEAGAFTLTTVHRPQSLWIDPDRECHRLVRKVSFGDRFYFEGNEG